MSVDKMIAEAEKTLGWSDQDNISKTPVHVWYELKFGNPDPSKYAWDWCDGWVTYVAYHAGEEEAVKVSGGQPDTQGHVARFKEAGLWHSGAAGIQRGDVVFFDWHDGNGIEHVGLALGPLVSGKLPTIEGNTLNVVAKRQREVANIAGYGRPKYTTTTPPSTGGGTTVPTQYAPPAFPAGLRPDSDSPSAKPLQRALKAAGYLSKTVGEADNYGPATQAAVAHFYKSHPALSEDAYDPEIGPQGWAVLFREAYGKATPPAPVTPTAPATSSVAAEPPADYRRLTYGGKTVNVRTKVMLDRARGLMSLSGQFGLTQGSYNTGVAASAGTHDGGGCVDINTDGLSINATLRALRQAGFAAWYRTPSEGFAYHIHAVAIGDRELASIAHGQVFAYFNGRNGLANNRADTAPASVGRPYPQWARKYA